MVNDLNEIMTLVNAESLGPETRGVIIVKDHLTASAAPQIRKICDEAGVIFVSSDEGSVEAGACIGVGVSERSIGVHAAKVASEITTGKLKPAEVGHHMLSQMNFYINKSWASSLKKGTCIGRNSINFELLKNSPFPVKEV